MIIAKGVPFLLQAGSKIGTAQLASKKEHLFQKIKFSNLFISLISVQNTPPSMQISTFFKMCREVLFLLAQQEIKYFKE